MHGFFRDELADWAAKGYDYIGAPWPVRPLYAHPLYKWGSALKTRMMAAEKRVVGRHVTRGRMGNGGFSLRHNRTIYELLRRHEERASYYVQRSSFHRYYEGVFFAVEAPALDAGFKIPMV